MTEMHWTKTKPDRTGWWWWKHDVRLEALHISQSQLENRNSWVYPNALWSSTPIPEPSEPPEHPLVKELRRIVGHKFVIWSELGALADKIQAALAEKP